jgi:hypothetical protein
MTPAAATARRATATAAPAAPRRKPATGRATAAPATPQRKPAPRRAPARKTTPARRAPARRPAQRRNTPLIGLAVGRTAVAVRGLPDCGPIVRLTRGRAWIPFLGALLAGIVALNVLTLSYTAKAGSIDSQSTVLQQENSVLQAREGRLLSNSRVHSAAASLGLIRLAPDQINYRHAGPAAVEAAAARLASGG